MDIIVTYIFHSGESGYGHTRYMRLDVKLFAHMESDQKLCS